MLPVEVIVISMVVLLLAAGLSAGMRRGVVAASEPFQVAADDLLDATQAVPCRRDGGKAQRTRLSAQTGVTELEHDEASCAWKRTSSLRRKCLASCRRYDDGFAVVTTALEVSQSAETTGSVVPTASVELMLTPSGTAAPDRRSSHKDAVLGREGRAR
jgi:hypothetical protein